MEILSEFVSLVPSWIPIVPALIVGFLVYYLPGIIFAILIGQKGLSLIALAPAISTSIFFSLAIIYFYTGINLNILTLSLGLVATLSLTFALTSLRKVQRPKFSDFFNKSSSRNLLILIPIFLIVCMVIFHLGEPLLYRRYAEADLGIHNTYIRNFSENQGLRTFPGYQRGMHLMGYIICSLTGIMPYVALDLITMIAAVSLCIGTIYMSRLFFTTPASALIGGVTGIIFASTLLTVGYDQLLPYHFGISLIPAEIAFIARYFIELRWIRSKILNQNLLFILVSGLGVTYIHFNAGAATILICATMIFSVKSFPKYFAIVFETIAICVYITVSNGAWGDPFVRPLVANSIFEAFGMLFSNVTYLHFLIPLNFLVIAILGIITSVANKTSWVALSALPFLVLQILDMCTGKTNSIWDTIDIILNSANFYQTWRLNNLYLIGLIPAILYGVKQLHIFLITCIKPKLVPIIACTIMLSLFTVNVKTFIDSSKGGNPNLAYRAVSRKTQGLLYDQNQNNFLFEVQKTIQPGAYIRRDNVPDSYNLLAQYGYKSVWRNGVSLPFYWTNWDLDEFKSYCQRIEAEPEFKIYLWVTEPNFRPSAFHKSVWSMGNKTIVSDGIDKLYDFNCENFGY